MTLKVAILGSGNIGCDTLAKVLRSPHLRCTRFAGRRAASGGLRFADGLGVTTSDGGADALLDAPDSFDLVFDATSASAHLAHADAFEGAGKVIVNMTPAARGAWCVPAINVGEVLEEPNINMITCGGQAAVPIAWALRSAGQEVEYVEAISSISARSAGEATRLNVSEYLTTTRDALRHFSGAPSSKAILNVNPAEPPVSMQTSVYALVNEPDAGRIERAIDEVVHGVRGYSPGYEVVVRPHHDGARFAVMVKVTGCGDYLPGYAGNLDIITCAAVTVAERISQRRARR